MNTLLPLESLYDMERGSDLQLPPDLAALYGRLQFPLHPGRPYVIGNFVSTLDGVVTLNVPGQSGGGPISGFNQHDLLVEGGPQLLGDFLAEGLLDELFLTLAPQIAGRDTSSGRPGLVTGQRFAPEHPLWGTLVSVKRAASHLFLRYAFETKETTT